jgi:hypothetical protein
MTVPPDQQSLKHINSVFGALRAEYLHGEIFDLFTKPSYWPELLSTRPCLLVGGRGTGKTTVLRGMSYEGQHHINPDSYDSWEYVGVYWRFDTSVVQAFKGAALPEALWTKIFGHYVNLVLCSLVLDFASWAERTTGTPLLFNRRLLARCGRSLGVKVENLGGLQDDISDAIVDLEVFVNNAAGSPTPFLSILKSPVALLLDALGGADGLSGRPVFFLLDEFENLVPYQQRVVNTLVKHSDAKLSYKIGMKETGHRERTTLNPNEQLIDPADYALIDIASRLTGGDYEEFATKVCAGRLDRISPGLLDPRSLFLGLSENEEAELLGAQRILGELRRRLAMQGASATELDQFDQMSHVSALLVSFWAEGHRGTSELEILQECLSRPQEWEDRVNNYGRAALFSIHPKVRGIAKYYAGWDTYVQLSAGNIRYLLALTREAIVAQIEDGSSLLTPIPPATQTLAAQQVAERSLLQLQGLAVEGADLTRLILGLGRILGIMARNPHGHAPEVTQFRVAGVASNSSAQALLDAGVMHLALLRYSGDKMASVSGETKDFDYQPHPIFAPFFVYSHRRKRRFTLTVSELLSLSKDARSTITRVLARTGRGGDRDTQYLPEQLTLFSEFYSE